ncbi:hypothetical protein RJ639_041680 [Escallonia herrerae]|uniref:Uncharacterized protein n=1 Tax=Escallonia herrerae TaxID=1293975 RepID=A0AA88WIF5_9ASTE|nr:hypothetical protein RJ639_041466 [Escallonia herrerae]KAK3025883.1 hypothetical protein RJ639_041680 [Escallonia herrerae]
MQDLSSTTPPKHPLSSSFPPISHHPTSRNRNLHFPPPPSSKSPTTISLPHKPTKSPHFPSLSPPPPNNPNPEFQEKLLYLDSLGLDLFTLLSTHPPILTTPTAAIRSTVAALHRHAGLTPHDVRRAASMCPDLLTTPSVSLLPVLTFLLREARLDGRDLRRALHRRPRLLTSSVDSRLRPSLYFLQSTIGIPLLHKHTHLLSNSVEDKFLPRIDYFQKLGFSYKDTISMFRRFPSLFCYSIEGNFEPKFNYFVVEMGRELRELREFPQYFSFSLENRIKPRHQHCVEKGVILSLKAMLKSSDELFCERLEVCCGSSMPVRTSPLWCTDYESHNVGVI